MAVVINGNNGISYDDSGIQYYGTGNDLAIQFDGTDAIINEAGSGSLKLQSSSTTILEVTSSGIDVTGTLSIKGSTSGTTKAITSNSTATEVWHYVGSNGAMFRAYDDSANLMHISSSGNLGIGTTTPNTPLSGATGIVMDSGSSADCQLRLQNDTTGNTNADGGILSISGSDMYVWNYENSTLRFGTNNTERMRITNGGTLLFGTTDAAVWNNSTGEGTVIEPDAIQIARSGNPGLLVNRQSSDGEIVRLLKDGTAVGNISVVSGGIFIGNSSASTYANIRFTDNQVHPCTTTGGANDDAIDLGKGASRYRNLYLSDGIYLGGTTSDNYLDDYEEGVLNWKLQRSDQVAGTNNSSTKVTYTKIGSRVHISGYIYTQSTGSTTGVQARLLNTSDDSVATLPFVPNHNGVLQVGHTRTMDPFDGLLSIAFAKNSATVYVYQNNSTGDYVADTNNVDISNSQTHLVITFQGVYSTDS